MNPPDPAAVAEALYDAVGLLRRRSRRLAGAPFVDLALSGAQLELVRLVRRHPRVAVADAATMLGLAPNTVSTLVGQLVSAGILVRETHEVDRRVAALDLTPDARESLELWRDRRSAAAIEALGRLTPAELACVAEALPLIARVGAALPDPTRAAAGAVEP